MTTSRRVLAHRLAAWSVKPGRWRQLRVRTVGVHGCPAASVDFPPVTTWPDYRIEAQVLAAVAGQLPTPVPQVHAAGEHDGWGYVLMSRLPGVPLDTVWDRVSAQDRDRLAAQLGHAIAALHQMPPPVIKDWWPADWPSFVSGQQARCVREQRELGLPAVWADQGCSSPRAMPGSWPRRWPATATTGIS